ncbi:MAG: H-NS histone family protein [Gammaproteobacteria bacterium]|nr:H-NS histone family protein [Gammaproteobacteria bacterium]
MTTSSYKDLIAQREALDSQIAVLRKQEIATAVQSVRQMVAEFGLTEADVFPAGRKSSTKGAVVAPKYRNPASGATWTGRGKPPIWIRDKNRAEFAINP